MFTLFRICAIVALITSGNAWAEGDPAAGREKSAACRNCHGESGDGGKYAEPGIPKLAGQLAGYLEKQIMDFREGRRAGATMALMAKSIATPQDVKDIAAYFSSQKKMAGTPSTNPALEDQGRLLFGFFGCAGCHGEKGEGKNSRSAYMSYIPAISGQNKGYLAAQLGNFRKGVRANDETGAMRDITKTMKSDQIEALAEILSAQP